MRRRKGRPAGNAIRPEEQAILTVADALTVRAAARGVTVGAFDSVRELVGSDEAEIAVDHLVNTANHFRLAMRRDEYLLLLWAAERLDYTDCVTALDPELLLEEPRQPGQPGESGEPENPGPLPGRLRGSPRTDSAP